MSGPPPTSASAACSGRPLHLKLGLEEGRRLALVGAPAGWSVPDLPPGIEVLRGPAPAEVILAFFSAAAGFQTTLADLADLVFPTGSLWIAWPRRAAGHSTDLAENLIRRSAIEIGMVDVKVAALDHDWSGLKLVWRVSRRHRSPGPAPVGG